MESMSVGHPAEQAGQISATATREEWGEILSALVGWPPDRALEGVVGSFLAEVDGWGVGS